MVLHLETLHRDFTLESLCALVNDWAGDIDVQWNESVGRSIEEQRDNYLRVCFVAETLASVCTRPPLYDLHEPEESGNDIVLRTRLPGDAIPDRAALVERLWLLGGASSEEEDELVTFLGTLDEFMDTLSTLTPAYPELVEHYHYLVALVEEEMGDEDDNLEGEPT